MVEFIDRTELYLREDYVSQRAEYYPNTDHDDASVESSGYTYAHPPLTQGLVGWWPLHDDQARDLSGNDNHGTPNGGPTTGVSGRGGLGATSFDGIDDYITIPDLYSSPSALSMVAWVRPRAPDDGSRDGVINIGRNGGLKIRDSGSGTFEYYWNDGSYHLIAEPSVSADEWYHVAMTWDGGTVRAYLDGVQVGSGDYSSTGGDKSANRIGDVGGNVGSNPLDGNICDVRLYNRALSGQEIQTLYEWGSLDLARPPQPDVAAPSVSNFSVTE